MAVLTQRSTAATRNVDADGTDSPRSASPPPPLLDHAAAGGVAKDNGSSSAMKQPNIPKEGKTKNVVPTVAGSKGKSLKERSQIPYSLYVTCGTIFGLQYFSGMWRTETLERWYASLRQSAGSAASLMGYTRDLAKTAVSENADSIAWTEYARTGATALFCLFLFFVFVVAPARAGFWTGHRAWRHKVHRYMGLSYLAHYALAWVEFGTNYENSRTSYLVHVIAVNGIIQGFSAYFSFKVLPELNDPGYYSDRAVLSRSFVHENIFFTVMAVFGSIYYNPDCREVLRSNTGGRIIEAIYIFWPYILVRTWFPLTRFSNSGQTYKGRTVRNQRFYEIATLMVKFFFLWAKYFLGFYLNFMIYLDLVKEEHWKVIHGMLLLNAGTVSLSVFLHTLRFKRVLPAKFTMTVYLAQIYLSFMALPMVFDMMVSHHKLGALCVAGVLANMTRNRKMHAVWCAVAMALMTLTDIKW